MGRGRRSTSDEVEASAGQDDVPTGPETSSALPRILGAGCSPSVGGTMPSPYPVLPVAPIADIAAAAAGGTSRGGAHHHSER
jgi:hypothetical protein